MQNDKRRRSRLLTQTEITSLQTCNFEDFLRPKVSQTRSLKELLGANFSVLGTCFEHKKVSVIFAKKEFVQNMILCAFFLF